MVALAVAIATFVLRPPARAAAPDDKDVAALVANAKQAAGAGDFAAALADFERAQAWAPSPALQFNIAVCHHSLMLSASDRDQREAHRVAAIAAYHAYLDGAPDATDRADVERIIAKLGPVPAPTSSPPGPPPALRAVVTRLQPSDAPSDPAEVTPVEVTPAAATPATAPSPVAQPRRFPRGRVGPFALLALPQMGHLLDSGQVSHAPLLGLGVRGGAFLGAKSRINIGAELSGSLQPTRTSARHTLWSGQLLATFEYGASLGRSQRFALAGGGIIGFSGQSLRHRGLSNLDCRLRDTGEISSRAGFVLGARLALLVLLGKRRNHELGLRITPALTSSSAGTGAGPDGMCGVRPFAGAGLPGGAALVTTIDLGYAPRF